MTPGDPYVKNQFAFLNPVADAGGFADHDASAAKSVSSLALPAMTPPGAITSGAAVSNVACPAGSATTVATAGASPSLSGKYTGGVTVCVYFALGATAPSAIVVRINLLGSAVSISVPAAFLVNNAVFCFSTTLVEGPGVVSGPDTASFTVQPTGQAVTASAGSSIMAEYLGSI